MLAPTQGLNVIVSQPNVSESFSIYRHMSTLKSVDDTADIVGFLAFEMVHSLAVAALDVKKVLEESYLRRTSPLRIYWVYASPITGIRYFSNNKCRHENSTDDVEMPLPVSSLFVQPPEARTPLQPSHIQDAFTRPCCGIHQRAAMSDLCT